MQWNWSMTEPEPRAASDDRVYSVPPGIFKLEPAPPGYYEHVADMPLEPGPARPQRLEPERPHDLAPDTGHTPEPQTPEGVAGEAGVVAANGPADIVAAEAPSTRGVTVTKSIQEWMREGEELYSSTLREYQDLEAQILDLERRMAGKQAEVNQIASIIGKPPVEGNRRLTAQLVDEHGPNSVPHSPATIARALAGKTLNR